jgi:hypothetical protein
LRREDPVADDVESSVLGETLHLAGSESLEGERRAREDRVLGRTHRRPVGVPVGEPQPDREHGDQAARAVARSGDPVHGGWQRAPQRVVQVQVALAAAGPDRPAGGGSEQAIPEARHDDEERARDARLLVAAFVHAVADDAVGVRVEVVPANAVGTRDGIAGGVVRGIAVEHRLDLR